MLDRKPVDTMTQTRAPVRLLISLKIFSTFFFFLFPTTSFPTFPIQPQSIQFNPVSSYSIISILVPHPEAFPFWRSPLPDQSTLSFPSFYQASIFTLFLVSLYNVSILFFLHFVYSRFTKYIVTEKSPRLTNRLYRNVSYLHEILDLSSAVYN